MGVPDLCSPGPLSQEILFLPSFCHFDTFWASPRLSLPSAKINPFLKFVRFRFSISLNFLQIEKPCDFHKPFLPPLPSATPLVNFPLVWTLPNGPPQVWENRIISCVLASIFGTWWGPFWGGPPFGKLHSHCPNQISTPSSFPAGATKS